MGRLVLNGIPPPPMRSLTEFMDGLVDDTRDGIVIIVNRLNGPPFAINPDLLERIESTPDTILVLVDGSRFIVQESVQEIIDKTLEHRAALIVRARELQEQAASTPPSQARLAAVPTEDEPGEPPPPVPLRRKGD